MELKTCPLNDYSVGVCLPGQEIRNYDVVANGFHCKDNFISFYSHDKERREEFCAAFTHVIYIFLKIPKKEQNEDAELSENFGVIH